MSQYPFKERNGAILNIAEKGNSPIQHQSYAQWKSKYNANVAQIKQELDELRKATEDLKRKISENQSRIKNALEAKIPKQAQNTEISSKQNRNPQETVFDKETLRDTKFSPSLKIHDLASSCPIGLFEETISVKFDQRIQKEQTTFQKILRYFDNFNDFLFRKIVKQRIKPRKSKKKQQELKQFNNRKASIMNRNVKQPPPRSLKSVKSLRV